MSGRTAILGWIGFICVGALTACNSNTSPGSHPLVGKWEITEAALISVSRTSPPSALSPNDSSATKQNETGNGYYLDIKENCTVLAAFPDVLYAGNGAFNSAAKVEQITGTCSVSESNSTLIMEGKDTLVTDANKFAMTLAGTNLDLVQTLSAVETVDDTTYTNIQVRSFRATKAN